MVQTLPHRTLTRGALALSLAFAAGAAAAAQPGYLTSTRDTVVKSGFGLCWHTSDWTQAKAMEPCDAVPRVEAPMVPVVAPKPVVAPAPVPPPKMASEPAPQPKVAIAPAAPVIERLSIDTELLFDFDSATLRPGGRAKLEEIVLKLHDAKIDAIQAIGHADRIASKSYNQALSEERAQAVKAYLSKLGLESGNIEAMGLGETESVTGGKCARLGAEKRENLKLVACLQPDRRVELEVRGVK